jgi:Fe-S cluster biogenesis protein NfuA
VNDHAVERTLEVVLARDVRPALSSHAGTIVVVDIDRAQQLVTLEMRGACGPCYFRRGCEFNLVRPALEAAPSESGNYSFRITGASRSNPVGRGGKDRRTVPRVADEENASSHRTSAPPH